MVRRILQCVRICIRNQSCWERAMLSSAILQKARSFKDLFAMTAHGQSTFTYWPQYLSTPLSIPSRPTEIAYEVFYTSWSELNANRTWKVFSQLVVKCPRLDSKIAWPVLNNFHIMKNDKNPSIVHCPWTYYEIGEVLFLWFHISLDGNFT